MSQDYLGDEMPLGYKAWRCDTCSAVCNYEAMSLCAHVRSMHPGAECGFDRDQPESNGGCFGFMVPEERLVRT